MKGTNRLTGLLIFLMVTIFLTGCGSKSAGSTENSESKNEEITVTIGIQQSIWPILLAKHKGWFEEEFEKAGAKVKWAEFQSGPSYFEAIASGRLDFGRVGNIPVLSGQGADIPFKEIAAASTGEKGDAILVHKDSPIQKPEDLIGKKVAVAKGSSAFGLLYRFLENENIEPSEIEIIQLQPDEAQAAFETHKVDAWAIWEPYQSIQTVKNEARILSNGEAIGTFSPGFQIVRTQFAEEHPELVELYLKVTEKATRWQNENKEEAIAIYSELKNTDKEVIQRVLENSVPANTPIDESIMHEQQTTADLLLELGGLKKELDVSEVVDNSFIEKVLKEYE
ncbi:aliphatic sulfonate ABC transporter substrate-binding protein [Peribacillus frigoritolerans]|uniref:aliphatic sulfonate ABC transporter substrate-binding protein n=1 Tax=Peribacillus frigoritolerans TaxID=450367 RepID=UPI00105A51E3|nr:aliphatic sulfonate ABC transporter substrate-binding protein [Peribacillus frigoritolerans]TDL80414.1 aliphatic sulfonate ABC transporter substrate-binding protein [Peribacillus frigoritolerans]